MEHLYPFRKFYFLFPWIKNDPLLSPFRVQIKEVFENIYETEVHPYLLYHIFIYLNLFLIDGKLLYSAVLVSVVQ